MSDDDRLSEREQLQRLITEAWHRGDSDVDAILAAGWVSPEKHRSFISDVLTVLADLIESGHDSEDGA